MKRYGRYNTIYRLAETCSIGMFVLRDAVCLSVCCVVYFTRFIFLVNCLQHS